MKRQNIEYLISLGAEIYENISKFKKNWVDSILSVFIYKLNEYSKDVEDTFEYIAQVVLERKPDIWDAPMEYGDSPFFHLLHKSRSNLIKRMMEIKEPKLHLKNFDGGNILHQLWYLDDYPLCIEIANKVLKKHRHLVNSDNASRQSPIFGFRHNTEYLTLLLDSGSNINVRDVNKEHILHVLARFYCTRQDRPKELLRRIVKNLSGDLRTPDQFGCNVLYYLGQNFFEWLDTQD